MREIARVRDEPVPADELARAKGYLLGRYTMDRRTNERLAWYLAFYEVEGVGLEYPDRYRARVEAVTAADVQRVARTYLANPTTVILGPPLASGCAKRPICFVGALGRLAPGPSSAAWACLGRSSRSRRAPSMRACAERSYGRRRGGAAIVTAGNVAGVPATAR